MRKNQVLLLLLLAVTSSYGHLGKGILGGIFSGVQDELNKVVSTATNVLAHGANFNVAGQVNHEAGYRPIVPPSKPNKETVVVEVEIVDQPIPNGQGQPQHFPNQNGFIGPNNGYNHYRPGMNHGHVNQHQPGFNHNGYGQGAYGYGGQNNNGFGGQNNNGYGYGGGHGYGGQNNNGFGGQNNNGGLNHNEYGQGGHGNGGHYNNGYKPNNNGYGQNNNGYGQTSNGYGGNSNNGYGGQNNNGNNGQNNNGYGQTTHGYGEQNNNQFGQNGNQGGGQNNNQHGQTHGFDGQNSNGFEHHNNGFGGQNSNEPDHTPRPISELPNENDYKKPYSTTVKPTTKKPVEDDRPLFVPLSPNDYSYGGDKITVNDPKRDTSKDQAAENPEEEFPIDIRFKDE